MQHLCRSNEKSRTRLNLGKQPQIGLLLNGQGPQCCYPASHRECWVTKGSFSRHDLCGAIDAMSRPPSWVSGFHWQRR
jgi:hypothetical protein